MKGLVAVSVLLLLGVASAANIRNRRQTVPHISLDRCFEHWKSETNKKVQNIQSSGARVMDQLANVGKSEDAHRRINEQLETYFDAIYSPQSTPTNDECDRQLKQNWDNIMKSITDALNELMTPTTRYYQEIATAFNGWLQSVQQWFNKFLGGNNQG